VCNFSQAVGTAILIQALAGHGDVAESTRRRVLETAEEMGYLPDVTARRLQKG